MRDFVIILLLLSTASGCTLTASNDTVVRGSEWSACFTKNGNDALTLDRSRFPAHDAGRINRSDLVRFSVAGGGYGAWQTATRLADSAGARWIFTQDSRDSDVLFIDLDELLPKQPGGVLIALGEFGLGKEQQLQIVETVFSVEPEPILFFIVERALLSDERYGKVIVTRGSASWTYQVGVYAFASMAAIGGQKDFLALSACRARLSVPAILPPRPTEEARALFAALLKL